MTGRPEVSGLGAWGPTGESGKTDEEEGEISCHLRSRCKSLKEGRRVREGGRARALARDRPLEEELLLDVEERRCPDIVESIEA